MKNVACLVTLTHLMMTELELKLTQKFNILAAPVSIASIESVEAAQVADGVGVYFHF